MELRWLGVVGLVVMLVLGLGSWQTAGEETMLPPVGSTFTFNVKTTGDKGATASLWQDPGEGEHLETHQYMGEVEGIKGKTRSGVIEDSKSHDCVWWKVTRPDKAGFYANFYYATEDNVLYYCLEEQSSGELKYYPNPLTMLSFPLAVGDKHQSNTTFYTNVPDTGISLARSYESPSTTKDTIKVTVTVDGRERVSVANETFDCYKITTVFESHTGSFITAATTTVTMERWWSTELGYFVKEYDTVFMDALMDSKGTVEKELVSYSLA
jgi:hypothetical protein